MENLLKCLMLENSGLICSAIQVNPLEIFLTSDYYASSVPVNAPHNK